VTAREKEGSCKLSSCIINTVKLQSDFENTGVFKDFGLVTVVGIAIILAHEGLQKHFKIGVQDVPKPCQNALRYQLHVGSASITALEGFWSPK